MVDENKSYSYVTVSHRWDKKVIMLTQDRDKPAEDHYWVHVETLGGGKPVGSFSQVFQKAFEIVEACRLRYVWIDSLCVIQDTVEKEGKKFNQDWEIEAKKMGDIYAGGVLYVIQAKPDSVKTGTMVSVMSESCKSAPNLTDFTVIAILPSQLRTTRPYVFLQKKALLCYRSSGNHRRNHQAMTQWTRTSRSC